MTYLDDLKLVEQAAVEAGAIVMKYFGTELDVERKAHAGFSPVTIADKEADAFLNAFLLKARPTYGWLSEEIEDNTERLSKEKVFVVDPIDGTKPFIKGEPCFAVSIGIVENGVPVVGAVFNPAKGELFSAAKGCGVFFNGEKMPEKVLKPSLKDMECLISRTERKHGLWDVFEGDFKMHAVGSIAYKLAMVAAGISDFMVTLRPKSEWDCAAGHVLCTEAGLKVTDIEGAPVLYNTAEPDGGINRMIAIHPSFYDEIKNLIHSKCA